MMKWLNSQPKWLKIVFALPVIDIVWVIARVLLSIEKNNWGALILAIILIIVGIPFLWLVDIITIIIKDTVLWFDN